MKKAVKTEKGRYIKYIFIFKLSYFDVIKIFKLINFQKSEVLKKAVIESYRALKRNYLNTFKLFHPTLHTGYFLTLGWTKVTNSVIAVVTKPTEV